MTMGCRQDNTRYFSGKIHAFEIFFTEKSCDRIPDEIALMIADSHKTDLQPNQRQINFECNSDLI